MGRQGGLTYLPRGVAERLISLHDEIKGNDGMMALSRIAVALYDSNTDILKTFIHSSGQESPLNHITARLADLHSLHELAQTGSRRTVNDLDAIAGAGEHDYLRRLIAAGYHASHTVPILHKGMFYGFVFFNAAEANFFSPEVLHRLRPYIDLICLAVVSELDAVRMMQATVKVIRSVSSARDEETGAHLARMARYSRLIAQVLASKYDLDDEFIEFLFQFAPLHDVGKIAVPDSILLKPSRLTEAEFEIMKSHVTKGEEIIDMMIRDFGLHSVPHFEILRNVVVFHHEALDGSGYPYGRKGNAIPLEARIAAVADVFDALTSIRPYKAAWSNKQAFELLQKNSGIRFDPDCVAALVDNADAVLEIQAQFSETYYD